MSESLNSTINVNKIKHSHTYKDSSNYWTPLATITEEEEEEEETEEQETTETTWDTQHPRSITAFATKMRQ